MAVGSQEKGWQDALFPHNFAVALETKRMSKNKAANVKIRGT
jgi:hypothetical protein